MTKSTVDDWDGTTASNNTDVGGISLAENVTRVPALNNIVREVMKQVKAKFTAAIVEFGAGVHALTGKSVPIGADEVGISDSAASNVGKKVTLTQWWAQFGVFVAAFTAKSTPVDADVIGISDSAASSAAKGTTFTQAWTNYFKAKADALYQPLKTILTAIGALSNAAGVLTNDGSGGVSWAAGNSYTAPSTSALPVGAWCVCQQTSGGTLADAATTAGTNIKPLISATPGFGVAQTGTWKNISGSSVTTNNTGIFVRTV